MPIKDFNKVVNIEEQKKKLKWTCICHFRHRIHCCYPNISFDLGDPNNEAEKTEPTTSSHLSTVNSDETEDVFSELGKPK